MDPSNSFESQASVNANQPEQTETITFMNRDYYNAAAEGKVEVFKNIIDPEPLDLLLTPNKNTILHIYITALNSGSNSTTPNAGTESTTLIGRLGSTINFVKKILKICPSLLRQANAKSETPLHTAAGSEPTTTLNAGAESTTNFVEEILKMCPSLLWQANAKCETPLHIAARYGHDGIVEVLIEYCAQTRAQTRHDQDLEEEIEPVKELLRMTNKEKDTALHEAVRYNHLEVVKLLISKDPDFSYSANDAGETPLYIAAERGFEDVLFEILDKCKSPMHGGPLGRTALHAAVMPSGTGMIKRILETIDGISREVDNNRWTPLHLAAYFGYENIAKQLLDKDREVAYMKDTEGRTPLHIAAQRSNANTMKVIVERCPDCCELVDNRGWNVLHFAIKVQRYYLEKIMDIIIENWSFSNLLNEKNADGDTPLHFYATTSSESLIVLKKFVRHPRLDKMAFNKQHLNAQEIVFATETRSRTS
ncbi:ankyrin repeat-containing protein At5g02620-like [Corylus avellana]|uniref:ankyrin repeat-containing protein At5g02620-like n=1 Tax=Corylus avellana TaxID=13451 RepID=UPI001E1F89C8|nr:ankyrin repeat-containing protein At5g02620-like [Corylus avellana]